MAEDREVGVFTPLSEWMRRIEDNNTAGFARIEALLDRKAEKNDVDELRREVRELNGRVASLEKTEEIKRGVADSHEKRDTKQLTRWQIAGRLVGWSWGAVTTVALILATAGVWHP